MAPFPVLFPLGFGGGMLLRSLGDRLGRTAAPLCVLAAVALILVCAAAPAAAQRVQFPSTVPQGSPYGAGTYGGTTYGASPYATTPPGGATLGTNVQPLYQGWDPYANPATQTPTLTPYGQPTTPYGQPTSPYGPGVDGTLAPQTKVIQQVSISNAWLYGDSDPGSFGQNDVEISATAAFPSLYLHPSPILITPGFNFHFWNFPVDSPAPIDLPPVVYDAYLAGSWKPQFTPAVGADLAISVGVYSDFEYYDTDSLRILGRALAVVTLSPAWQLQAGVLYLDRLQVDWLPAGGLVWTPHSDMRLEILFPRPKLAQRWTTWGNTDVWLFIAGEYGGGQWTVRRGTAAKGQFDDTVNYNDYRVMVGAEFIGYQGVTGQFEVGYIFEREIIYEGLDPDFEPDDTLMLRAGIQF